MGAEYAEFAILYPDVPFSSIGDAVMEDVKRGIPLAAAYALSERRRRHAEEKARKSNEENLRRSSGGIKSSGDDFFSPDEVRRMSRDEVRTNYSKIMASMQKWR